MLLGLLSDHDYESVRDALVAMLKKNDAAELPPARQEAYFAGILRSIAPPRARPEPPPIVDTPARPRSFSKMQDLLGMYIPKNYVPPAPPRALTPEEQLAADLAYAEYHMENMARSISADEDF